MRNRLIKYLKLSFAFILLIKGTSLYAESNLIENSPFIPYDYKGPTGGFPVGPSTTGPIQLRGIFALGEQIKFSIYNSTTQKAEWVGLKDPTAPYYVEDYNPVTNTISLNVRGQRQTLALSKPSDEPLAIKSNISTISSAPTASLRDRVKARAEAATAELSPEEREKRKAMADKVFNAFRKYVAEKRRREAEASGNPIPEPDEEEEDEDNE